MRRIFVHIFPGNGPAAWQLGGGGAIIYVLRLSMGQERVTDGYQQGRAD